MDIRIAGIVSESFVDGPGLRLAVFTQGCLHACEGCHNPASHPMDGGELSDTEQILVKLRKNPMLSGLTLTGGEPLLQPEACLALAAGAKALHKNVWIYTGYTWEELLAENDPARMALLKSADVLVDGRFELSQRTLELPFRGSHNQRLIDVQASLKTGRVVLHVLPTWSDAVAPEK